MKQNYVKCSTQTSGNRISLQSFSTLEIPDWYEHSAVHEWNVLLMCWQHLWLWENGCGLQLKRGSDKTNCAVSWRKTWIAWEVCNVKGVWLNSFRIKVVENIKTHFMFSNPPPPKFVPFMRKCGKTWQPDRPHDNIIGWTKYAICVLGN